MKLKDVADSSNNNFDWLRFIAATLVIFSHSYSLLGEDAFEPLLRFSIYDSFGGFAVSVFFVISGFLISKSWHSNPDLFIYLKKRILRIYPGLLCAVLFSLLIIGPIATSSSIHDYFTDLSSYKYVRNIFLIHIKDDLPGVFLNNPLKGAVNGSLWTLPCEFFLYLLIAAVGLFKLSRQKLIVPLLIIIGWCLYNYLFTGSLRDAKFLWLPGKPFLKLAVFFLTGSCFYLFREKIVLSFGNFVAAFVTYIISIKANSLVGSFLTLPYVVLYLAYAPIPFLNKWGKHGDFSYGLYVYAFPIQQTIVYVSKGSLNVFTLFSLSFLITLSLAVLSWHLIEKKALRLKDMRRGSNLSRWEANLAE